MIIDTSEERMVIVSDLHLGNPASRAGETFQSFLDFVRAAGFSLCLNGDGFEMLQTRFSRLVREALPLMTQISRLRREGRNVYYVVGNHDIFVEHFLDEWLGAAVCPFLNVASGGRRIRIEHGHLYDPFFSRSPDLYESLTRLGGYFLFMRPDIYRLWDVAARRLELRRRRSHSVAHDPISPRRAAEEVLGRGFDVVVHAHTHREQVVDLDGGLYVNSGTWMKGGTYVEIENGSVELKQWPHRSE